MFKNLNGKIIYIKDIILCEKKDYQFPKFVKGE